nr:Qat anti-phage system associated protein QatB [Mycolicibacterium phlei]
MGGTTKTAGRLYGVLESGRAPDGTDLRDAVLATGNDINAILDAIADAASPLDGTQDAESSRTAVRDALSALLEEYPDIDVFALTDEQRLFVIERYIALDIFNRFCLDLQTTIVEKSPDLVTGLRRVNQVQEFIVEHVAAAFRDLREYGSSVTSSKIAQLAHDALRTTFSVFEDYT